MPTTSSGNGEVVTGVKGAKLKLTTSVDYYRLEMNGKEMFEFDVENGKRIIGGTDQLADMRRAMGL